MSAIAETSAHRKRGGDTRRLLMDAALAIFTAEGYERATVDEIVREAGFSKGAFYVHFESKEDLFWALLEERIEHQQEAFREAMSPTAPAAESLRTILDGVFTLDRKDPLWRAIFPEFAAHAARNEKVRGRLADLYARWHGFIVSALEAGQGAGRVRKDIDADFVASVLIAVVEGTIMQSRLAPDRVRLEVMAEPLSQLLAQWLEP